jgi:hypothetical protein
MYSDIGDSFSESIVNMWKSVTGTDSVEDMLFTPDPEIRKQAVAEFYRREGQETGLPPNLLPTDLARMIRTSAYWKNMTNGVGYVVIPEMPDTLGMVESAKRMAGLEAGRVYDIQVLLDKLNNIVNGQGGMVANVTVNGANGTNSTELAQIVSNDTITTIMTSTVDMIKNVVSKQMAQHHTDQELMTGIKSSISSMVKDTGTYEMSPMVTTFGEYINDAYNNTDIGGLCRFIGKSIGRKMKKDVEFKCSDLLRLYNVSTILDTCMDPAAIDEALQERREEWSGVIQNMMQKEKTWRHQDEIDAASNTNVLSGGLVGAFWTVVKGYVQKGAAEKATTLGPVAGRDAKELMMAASGDPSLQNSPRFKRAVEMIAKLTSIITPIGEKIVHEGGTLQKGYMHDDCMGMSERVNEYAKTASGLYGTYMEKEVLSIINTTLREEMRMGHVETIKFTVSVLVCAFEASAIGIALNHKKCKLRAMYEYMAARGGCKLNAMKETAIRAKDKAKRMATTTKDAVVRAKDNVMGGLRRMAGLHTTTMMYTDCCTATSRLS